MSATNAKSWYSTGYDGMDKERDRLARLSGPSRFWMPENTKRDIMFVDDEPFSIYEHQYRANGKWGNFVTCLRDSSDVAPCCEKLGDKSRYYVGFYTIIDLTESIDTKGKKYQYELKFLPAKMKTLQVLRTKKADRGSLVGTVYRVARYTKDDPNCGGEFEFQKEGGLDKIYPLANYRGKKLTELFTKESVGNPDTLERLRATFNLTVDNGQIAPKVYPFNYFSLLAPRDAKDVRTMVGQAQLEGDAARTDDIPF